MSFAGDISAAAPRVSLTNLRTAETFELPYVPETFEEEVAVNWNRQQILGLSHDVLQYGHTSSYRLDGVEFYFRGVTPDEVEAIHEGRRFLMHLCYPLEGAGGIRDGAPPRVLLFWPEVLSLTCVLEGLRITHERFNRTGRTVEFRARVTLTEIRDVRLTGDEVRVVGTQRSSPEE